MNNVRAFIVFLIVVLAVYGVVNYYLYRRVVGASDLVGVWGVVLRIGLWALILSYPVGRALYVPFPQVAPLMGVGSFWLGAMTYGLLYALLVDLIRLGDIALGWIPDPLLRSPRQAGRWALLSGVVIVGIILIAGRLSAQNPRAIFYTLPLSSLAPHHDGFRIVMFADTHFGALVGRSQAQKLVTLVNSLRPDVVFIVGDLIDEPVERVGWLGDYIAQMHAPQGIWAVTGNHEYYSGVNSAVAQFERWGIRVLRNEVVSVGGVLNLIGLNDLTGARQFGEPQVSIKDLVKMVNPLRPTLLLHHTPLRYQEAQRAGVEVMFTGHTHGGQLWPFGYITQRVYNVKSGLTKMGNLQFILTNGAYTWGPPIRVGAPGEVVVVNLRATPSSTPPDQE